MKIRKRLLCMALAIMLLSALVLPAASADGTHGERWNIMIVLDGSATMWSGITSDPDGLRYEAVGSFLDTLHTSGHKVGGIVFTANQRKSDNSDEAMENGIMVNTGMIDLDSASAREKIKNDIRYAERIYNDTPQTDIGTALMVAERELEKLSGNGNRSAIFLFTDGVIDVHPNHEEKAQRNLTTALDKMLENNMLLCGVYLNKDGKAYSPQIREIVCAANGIQAEGLGLGNYYVEITDPKSCAESTDKFMQLLGYSIPNPIPIPNDFTSTFRVPGVGVEEANIRLRTDSGKALPNGIEVTFTRPDGTTAPASAVASLCSVGKTYQVYKLENPASGKWTVHVRVPDNNKVAIYYTPVFSFYVGAGMQRDLPDSDMLAGRDVNVRLYLEQDGMILTDPANYREYKCEFVMTDLMSGAEVLRQEILPNGNGEYWFSHTHGYGLYEVAGEFTCDQLSVSTAPETWDTRNHVPTAGDISVKQEHSFLFDGAATYDLAERIDDLEDGKNLALAIVDYGKCNEKGISLDGMTLSVVGRESGSGQVKISVTDSQGASEILDFSVATKDLSIPIIIGIAALLLVIAIVVFFAIRGRNKTRPTGELTVDISFTDEDGYEVEMDGVVLSCPGTQGMPRSCKLSQLISRQANDEYSGLRHEYGENKFRQLQKYIGSAGKFLDSVVISPVRTKYDGKTVTAIKVKSSNGTEVLYNKSGSYISNNGAGVRLSYMVDAGDDDSLIDDDGFRDPFADDTPLDHVYEDRKSSFSDWDDI